MGVEEWRGGGLDHWEVGAGMRKGRVRGCVRRKRRGERKDKSGEYGDH